MQHYLKFETSNNLYFCQYLYHTIFLNTDLTFQPFSDILGVIIHGCDGLVPDLLVCHPLVRVYVVDQNTGEFLKRSMSEKQSNHDPAEFILPLMTQPFDFYNKKLVLGTLNFCLMNKLSFEFFYFNFYFEKSQNIGIFSPHNFSPHVDNVDGGVLE